MLNNSVFGKTMENVRNRVDIQLVNSEKKVKKLQNNSRFDKSTSFSKYLAAVHMHRKSVKLNKPKYLGFSIFEYSKNIMYNFHYKFTKGIIGGIKSNLLYTDTDSLIYEFYTEDIYKVTSPYVKEYFDTSNYPKEHPSGIITGVNKKVRGMMKDEKCGRIILNFVSPRPKIYYIVTQGEEDTKRCKGINKNVIKKGISYEDVANCVLVKKEKNIAMNHIKSHEHNLYTEKIEKVALDPNDDKRIISDGINTLAYGHYRTLKQSKHLTKMEKMFNYF